MNPLGKRKHLPGCCRQVLTSGDLATDLPSKLHIPLTASELDSASLHKPVVVPEKQMLLHLLHRVQAYADDNQQARPTKNSAEERYADRLQQHEREDRDCSKEQRAWKRYPRKNS